MLHTRGDDFAEDVDAVNDAAVPATMLKLMLALADGQLSAVPHSDHVLRVTTADPPLTPSQPSQPAALGVRRGSNVVRQYGVGRQMTNIAN